MIKGFLFDKDGTLIDFKSIWLPIAQSIAREVVTQYGSHKSADELLEAVGVMKGEIDGAGILASKTVVEVSEVWHKALLNPPHLEAFTKEMDLVFYEAIHQQISKVRLLPGVKEALLNLKERGFILGIATADSQSTTMLMLEHLEIKQLFTYIGTEDGKTLPKPHKAHMEAFCKSAQIMPGEVAMVGDTLCDMIFGKNSGALSIGVLSGTGKASVLEAYADYLIPSVASLKEQSVWEI